MHKKTVRFLPLASVFFTCLALTASAVVPPVEKLLPDDTLFVVTIPDFTKMREIYRTSPQTQFWNDPAMKPFKERFLAKLSEDLIHPLERDLGVQLADYTNLLQGQITLAMSQNDWPAKEGQHPGLLLLLDTKDKSGQLTKNLSDIRKKWIEAGKTLRTQKIRNIEFAAYPISSKDMPKTLRKFSGPDTETDSDETETNTPKSELFIGQNESLLIIGTEAAPIEKVLAHMTGGSVPSLGDLAAYDRNRLTMFRDAPLYGWANAKLLMDALTHKPAKQDSDTPDPFAILNPSKILPAIGLAGVKTLGFSMQIGNDGTTMQVFASVPEESRQGLLKVLPGDAKDSTPPGFVPVDAVKFQRWRIDGQKTWTAIQKVLGDISPQAVSYINYALSTVNELAKQKDPNFDINKSLFGNLGDDVISYQKAPKGKTLADLNSPPSLLLIGSPNAEQFSSALKYLFALANQQAATPEEREFLGRKIYSIPLPGSPIPSASLSAAAKPRTLSYAASGGYVALSTDASMVEEYLRSSDGEHKALRDAPGLTDAIAKAGGSSTGMFGYENQTETTRVMFDVLKSGVATNSSSASMSPFGTFPGTDAFKDWADFSLLPSYDSVSKYFGMSVYTMSANVDGLLFKIFAPVPPGLRK
jgi:hypothetical protein